MMKMARNIVVICFFICSLWVLGQGTLKEYHRAISIDSLFKNKVYNSPKEFHWLDSERFWYLNNSENGSQYLLVDAKQKEQKMLFDHQKLANALSRETKNKIKAINLKLNNLIFFPVKNEMKFNFGNRNFVVNLRNYEFKGEEAFIEGGREESLDYWGDNFDESINKFVFSPDSLMKAYIKNYNLYIQDNLSQQEEQLSYDGSQDNFYSSYIKWAPDGKKIMAYKIRPGADRKIYFIESSPTDQLQPKLQSRDYLKPGDELPFKSPQLFILASKKHINIPVDLFSKQYSLTNIEWRKDSRAFTFEYNQRGHQVYRVIEVDSETGLVKVLVNETSSTFIDYSSKKYRFDLEDGKQIIWTSERDGWNHIYLFDGDTGQIKKQLTKGNWVVRKVIHVDEKKGEIYFTASGLDEDQDPYFVHYCKIGLDGNNFKRLTTENGNHKVTFSQNYEYYVDQYSRVDMPPITLLKKVNDTKKIMKLQSAGHFALLDEGWIAPEVFVAKGRDGITDIWGVVIRPTTFDPSKYYPIIEYIYAGPHGSFVPKDFNAYYSSMSSLAELGFIVVQIDGMGTSNRSKAFHDIAWKNLKDAGFPDRKLWITAVAKKYRYMNIDRVGIYGTSAGGQNAGAALVFNSDFYDVAVSSCGCHDNRMDKMWWNEQFMGYPIGPQYAECSNVENASQLEGDLMLILGEVDDNVDPASTMQFANALIKTSKNFELVTVPGMGHSSGGDYGERKRKDFFVRHLMNVTPPSWDKIYKVKSY